MDITEVYAISRKQFRKKESTKSRFSARDNNHTKSDLYIHSRKFCAGSYDRGKCPGYNQKCNKCKRKGHFAKLCRSKRSVDQLDADTASESDCDVDD